MQEAKITPEIILTDLALAQFNISKIIFNIKRVCTWFKIYFLYQSGQKAVQAERKSQIRFSEAENQTKFDIQDAYQGSIMRKAGLEGRRSNGQKKK